MSALLGILAVAASQHPSTYCILEVLSSHLYMMLPLSVIVKPLCEAYQTTVAVLSLPAERVSVAAVIGFVYTAIAVLIRGGQVRDSGKHVTSHSSRSIGEILCILCIWLMVSPAYCRDTPP